jgi:hypothetical protein
MKTALAIAMLVALAFPAFAQQQKDEDEPAEPQAKTRSQVRDTCRAVIMSATPAIRGDERRNAVAVCVAKAYYDCAREAADRKVAREPRHNFVETCLLRQNKS